MHRRAVSPLIRRGTTISPNRRLPQAADPLGAFTGSRRAGGKHPTSGRQVADYIRGQIFAGALRQGDYLRQNEIAEELGVSRLPVREAIVALEREGWISIERHRGAFVSGLDENSIRDHYALLGQLYGLAAERASDRGDADGIAALAAIARTLRRAEEPDAVLHANKTYLRQVFAMARSHRLHSLSRLRIELVPGNLFALVPEMIQEQKRGIDAVHRAIEQGDGARASAEFVTLLRGYGEHVAQTLKARDILSPSVPDRDRQRPRLRPDEFRDHC